MRCLVVADLHYALPQFDWVLNVADRFDLVIMAGDHLDLGSAVEGGAQIVVVRKYVELWRAKTKVICCSGNHDLDSRNAEGEKIANWLGGFRSHDVATDGDTVEIDDTLFTICPWWDGPLTQERIGQQIANDAKKRKGRWVWVHHAPSDQSPTSWSGKKHFGDAALRAWIEQFRPDLVVSGHVHQSPFVKEGSWVDRIGETWVFNTGQHIGAPPAHIVIDTNHGEAVWMSAAGIQAVNFKQQLQRPLPYLMAPPEWFTSPGRAGGQTPAQT